ncbi:unnamed protein product [Rotaria sordida]|nr:unnamed protein product [Rotaria sordida]CAF1462636.1 unnamed protein product [Rotaria sordida]
MFDIIQTQCSVKPLSSRNTHNCGIIDGKVRKFSDSWKSKDCKQCSCSRNGISCCSTLATPTNYDKKNCRAILNKRQCRYDVVKKSDKNTKCPVYGAVGR